MDRFNKVVVASTVAIAITPSVAATVEPHNNESLINDYHSKSISQI